MIGAGPPHTFAQQRITGEVRHDVCRHTVAPPVVAAQVEDQFPCTPLNLREGIVESLDRRTRAERTEFHVGHVTRIPLKAERFPETPAVASGQRNQVRIAIFSAGIDQPHAEGRTVGTTELDIMLRAGQTAQQLAGRLEATCTLVRCRYAGHRLGKAFGSRTSVHGDHLRTGRHLGSLLRAPPRSQ